MPDDDHSGSSLSAVDHRRENPIEHLSNDDIRGVERALESAAYSLLAVHRLAIDAIDVPQEEGEFYLVAIKELTRSSFRRLDARASGAWLAAPASAISQRNSRTSSAAPSMPRLA
jgi:hypothetical protein